MYRGIYVLVVAWTRTDNVLNRNRSMARIQGMFRLQPR